MIGVTLDTGALIALERRSQRMWELYKTANNDKMPLTVPTTVVIE